jgi:hypothetical protein
MVFGELNDEIGAPETKYGESSPFASARASQSVGTAKYLGICATSCREQQRESYPIVFQQSLSKNLASGLRDGADMHHTEIDKSSSRNRFGCWRRMACPLMQTPEKCAGLHWNMIPTKLQHAAAREQSWPERHRPILAGPQRGGGLGPEREILSTLRHRLRVAEALVGSQQTRWNFPRILMPASGRL